MLEIDKKTWLQKKKKMITLKDAALPNKLING